MPIKETTNKINFMSYTPKRGRRKSTDEAPTITLFVKKGKIAFPRYATEQMQMSKKFVRFYYEPVKKIIGWKVKDKLEQHEINLWRLCNVPNNGVWQVSVGNLLEEMQLGTKKMPDVYRNMVVHKYRDMGLMAVPNDTYFYVELSDEYAESSKGDSDRG